MVNGRAWYKNEGISIWWDGTNNWNIGSTTNKGSKKAYAFLKNDGTCLPKISNPKWKFGPSSSPDHSDWYDAGNAVKIRCGSNPGKEYVSYIKPIFSSFLDLCFNLLLQKLKNTRY